MNLALAPLTTGAALRTWQFSPVVSALLLGLAAAYLTAARRVGRRHPRRPWPAGRTLAFFLGLTVLAVATQSSIAVYDDVLFSVHMVQHLLLIMVAPPLLILGRPVTLAMHAARGRAHSAIKRLVRSRPVAAVTWPAGAAVGYAAVVAGTHLTPFLGLAAANGAAHDAEHALYVVAGYLYFLPLVGSEPIRWRLAMPGRYLLLLATMPVDTIVGIVLMAQARVPFGGYAREGRHWGPSPITDLHTGGAIMWIGSDVLMTALAVAVSAAFLCRPGAAGRLGTWLEGIRAANLARALTDAGVAVPAGSGPAGEHARLRAYNDYLAALAGPGEVNDAADGVAAPPAFPCGEPEVR